MKNETVKSNVYNTLGRVMPPAERLIAPSTVSQIHYHDELELISVYEGEFICTVYGKDHVAKAGEVIFINSRVPHSTRCTVPASTGLVQFKERDYIDSEISKIAKYSMRFQSQIPHPVCILNDKTLFDTVDMLYGEVSRRERSYEMFVKSAIYRILGFLYRSSILSDAEKLLSKKEVQKILPVLSYVNANFADNLTLEDVSAKLGFDRSYFCRVFKLATGATFTEYLNYVRICKAENMLQHTQQSIIEISGQVGFSSVSYFNRIFKKYRNCSPRFYRTVVCRNI